MIISKAQYTTLIGSFLNPEADQDGWQKHEHLLCVGAKDSTAMSARGVWLHSSIIRHRLKPDCERLRN